MTDFDIMNTFIHEIDRDIRHFETIITPYRVQLKTFEAYLDDIAFASYQYEMAARYRDYLEMKYNHIFVRRLSLRYAQEVVKDIYGMKNARKLFATRMFRDL